MSKFRKEAKEKAKPKKCVLCNKECTSFCNSHTIPQFVLKNMGNNGNYITGQSLLASLAEEESRSISSNTKWGMKKKLADGRFKINCEHLLYHAFDEDGNIVINEEETAIVRRVYSDYASGMNPHSMDIQLTAEGVQTKFKKNIWYEPIIRSILTNEKYMEI